MNEITSYPLCWVEGRDRTSYPQASKFKASMSTACTNLMRELKLLGASSITVSSNVPSKNDGMPYASYRKPDDQGVAVYFKTFKQQHCITCDSWDNVAHNIQAIALTIAATRGVKRWGAISTKEAFSPFALPPAKKNCWEILNLAPNSSLEDLKKALLDLSQTKHPDRGGKRRYCASVVVPTTRRLGKPSRGMDGNSISL